ncbi:hypothetical protein [Modestobacter sp. NPDC049651]|uniref:hypothetical protein n=1 Tax=unclassified Modestobacter TaxID=2643866 RepID=UPI0034034FA9
MTIPGPDGYTLRAIAELAAGLEAGAELDAAYAVVSDLAAHAFGAGWQAWYVEALDAEGDPDGVRLLADDDLADRVLARLHERMRAAADEDPGAPPAPETELVWSASSPRRTRERLRRAVSMLQPRRPDVAGERRRRERD